MWGEAGGWIPLPTHPQWYCDPVSLLYGVEANCFPFASFLFFLGSGPLWEKVLLEHRENLSICPKTSVLDTFWSAALKGRCPVGHMGEFPYVHPYVRPSIHPYIPPQSFSCLKFPSDNMGNCQNANFPLNIIENLQKSKKLQVSHWIPWKIDEN